MAVIDVDAYAHTALIAEERLVRYAPAGERNDTLYRASLNLGELVGGGSLHWADVEEHLLDAAMVVGLLEDEAILTIRSGMSAGEERPRRAPRAIKNRAEALGELAGILVTAHSLPWSGHRGKRIITVLTACVAIAHQNGGPANVPLSTDKVALFAGTRNRQLVQRGLWDCRQEGWLKLTAHGGHGRATRYRLRVPPLVSRTQASITPTHAPLRPDFATLEGLADVGHDAFRQRALDKTAWRILRSLADGEWHRQVDLANALGISRSTVWRYVRPTGRLFTRGLIERGERGTARLSTALPPSVFNAVAEGFGTLGDRDRHRHWLRWKYEALGWLTDDGNWIDHATGEVGPVAAWLINDGEDCC